MEKEQVKERVLLLRPEVEEAVAEYAAEAALEFVKNYCQREEIPAELASVCVELAVLFCDRAEQGGVKRLTEGDATVEFETREEAAMAPLLAQMQLFRRAKW